MSIVALVSLLFAGAAPAAAQEGDFDETFDTPELTGWETSPGVAVADGALQLGPEEFAARSGLWADFTLSLRLRYSGSGELLVHYYLRDESRYTIHLIENEMILLERFADGQGRELGGAPLPAIEANSPVELTIQIDGRQQHILLDNQLLLTASDPEPLQPGAIGLFAAGQRTVAVEQMHLALNEKAPEGESPPAEEPDGPLTVQDETRPQATVGTVGAGEDLPGLLDRLFDFQTGQVDLATFAVNLLLAALTSFVLGRVYIHWGNSLSNRRNLAANFMFITITTTFIILVVRSSVALSLGLVGALSIIRFRTAIKEPEELAFLFFAVGLGIGLGDNQRLITLIALAAGIVIAGLLRLFRRQSADFNLHLAVASHNPNRVDMDDILSALGPHCAKLKLMRFDETENDLETTFLVEFRGMDDLRAARAALRHLSSALQITFLENRGLW
jgi:hypothetical protein